MSKKKIFIVSSDNTCGPTGAAKFCRSLLSNSDYWTRNNILIRNFSNNETFSDSEKYTKSKKYKIKQWVKIRLNMFALGRRILFFNYKVNGLGKRPIRNVKKYIDKNTCILLNDIFVAINFYKQFHTEYKTIFMMHNGGELLGMMTGEMKDKKIAGYLQKVESMIYTNASKIVFVSKYAKEKFDKTHPECAEKTIYIYNGISNENIDISQRQYETLRLVTVGSVCKRKNQIAIIKAINKIEDKTIKLTIVGTGPLYEECERYIKNNKMESQIDMVGNQNDVFQYLKNANVFIMTSIDEGLPIAALEALNAHLPIIITDVGGCRDLIQGNGLLINLYEDEIIKAILKYNTDKRKLKEYGNRSYQMFINNFTVDLMLEKYCKLVKTL